MKDIEYELLEKCADNIETLRSKCPLVHAITNYITVNDCTNAVLAIGATAAVTGDYSEMHDFVDIASAVVINMGAPLEAQFESMLEVGRYAKETNTPLVIDPIAVGVTQLRNKCTKELLDVSSPYIIRGNMSEIKAVAKLYDIIVESDMAKGVDVADSDKLNLDNIKENARIVEKVAGLFDCVVNVSGKYDIISDGLETYVIDNGEPIMSKITGAGCMLTSVLGAFSTITNPMEAAIIATLSMNIAGELAYKTTRINKKGSASFRTHLIDELYNMNKDKIMKYGKLYKLEE